MDAWNAMAGADCEEVVVEEARKAGARRRAEVPRLDAEAMASTMTALGSSPSTTGTVAEWRAAADQFGSTMRAAWFQPMFTTWHAASAT